MRYLACIVMLFALLGGRPAIAQIMVQVSFHPAYVKGGEAQERQLHRKHRSPHASLRRRHALSAAVSLPRPRPNLELLHPERYQRLTPAQGLALASEVFRTPQERIIDAFQQLEEAYAGKFQHR